jgi:hypothetical protein
VTRPSEIRVVIGAPEAKGQRYYPLMRAVLLLAVALFACSEPTSGIDDALPADRGVGKDSGPEDADPIDAASTDAASTDADPRDADPRDADPADLGTAPDAGEERDAEPRDVGPDAGRTCENIEAEYFAEVAKDQCNDSLECTVIGGHCSVGLGGCWYTVNASVSVSLLNMLAQEYFALNCTTGVCDCIAPPPGSVCQGGVCVPF